MSKTIILKNTTEGYAQLCGMILNPLEEREISDQRILRTTLAEDDTAFAMVADGTVVVNNGTDDLTPALGWKWLIGRFFTAELSQQSYTSGNKIWTHTSPRPEKDDRTIFVYWAGAGESDSTLGSDAPIAIDVASTDVTKSHDIRFYKGVNGLEKTYVFKAHLMWADAGFGDTVTATAMAEPVALQQVSDLDYNVEPDGRLVYAGEGLGTHGLASYPAPVHNRDGTGYWYLSPADNSLSPRPNGDGNADIYTNEEKEYAIFLNQISVYGNSHGYNEFDNWDCIQLRPGYYIKFTANNNSGTNWKVFAFITMFRERAA